MELGNLLFNTNKNQVFECPRYIVNLLEGLSAVMCALYETKYKQEMDSPFSNTAAKFENETFRVEAYSWDDEYEQPYNFKWKDVEISWYKYLGRDTTINQEISPQKALKMFKECLESLDNF